MSEQAGAAAEKDQGKLNQMGDDYYFGDQADPGAVPTDDGDAGVGDGDAAPAAAPDGDAGVDAEEVPEEYQGVQL